MALGSEMDAMRATVFDVVEAQETYSVKVTDYSDWTLVCGTW